MVSFNGITTILFDLDGTLRHSVPNSLNVFMQVVADYGIPTDPETWRRQAQWALNYWAVSEDMAADYKTYDDENDEFWVNYRRRQLEAVDVPTGQAKLWAAEVNRKMEELYQPVDTILDDVFPTLSQLREAGFTLGLVTNRQNQVDEYLQSTGLVEHLDFWFAAGEIDAWKPKPEIFTYALGQANARPSQALYVGDNYYSDVVGARRAHIQPILLDKDDVFPDTDCPVIKAVGDIPELLRLRQPG